MGFGGGLERIQHSIPQPGSLHPGGRICLVARVTVEGAIYSAGFRVEVGFGDVRGL